MARTYDWHFPLPRTHTGMLQGNGVMGTMIWGGGGVLNVTIGRADFWDHRGGMEWTETMSFQRIRKCLDAGDSERLAALFASSPAPEGHPMRPSVIPIGRLEMDFGSEATLTTGTLDTDSGAVTVKVRSGGRTGTVAFALDMDNPVAAVSFTGIAPPKIRRVPAWKYVGDHLKEIRFEPPEMFAAKSLMGWVQERPADPALCLGYRKVGKELYLATAYGDDARQARAAASALIDECAGAGRSAIQKRANSWWSRHWKRVPAIDIPNDRLAFIYNYGMYKFAGLTNPDGIAATLQGPWIEEYQMPPWASDYHFNINVQMCYWPAYHGNCLEHLRPLFEMVKSWTPTLRHNAKMFLGIDDGLMLPHAVDDRGVCMGGFWAGSLDHGSTAWVAQMMYRYYRYTMDEQFLRETAWPFMVGAMRVYEEMLERNGETFELPVSVSPEYHSQAGMAGGRNASFQFACIHRLCEDLLEAADALGETPRPIWREIQQKCPKASLIGEDGAPRIAIWEGTDLEVSHRHHSHLAGIVPFDVLDVSDPKWSAIVSNSMNHWVLRGTGLWSGWCVPWAAMLHAHLGQGGAAEMLLESWERAFTNEGHGTLHDVHITGFSLMGSRYHGCPPAVGGGRTEIMQMDAGMSATAAVQEMLLHTRRGVTHVFPAVPERWRDASFEDMRTDGAFLVSASLKGGRVDRIAVDSPKGGVLKLANPWQGKARISRAGKTAKALAGRVLRIPTVKDDRLHITPA